MTIKSLHQFFYYHSKYLNSMKCREISMGPSIRTIQCSISTSWNRLFIQTSQRSQHTEVPCVSHCLQEKKKATLNTLLKTRTVRFCAKRRDIEQCFSLCGIHQMSYTEGNN
jgi:hypothetical protein